MSPNRLAAINAVFSFFDAREQLDQIAKYKTHRVPMKLVAPSKQRMLIPFRVLNWQTGVTCVTYRARTTVYVMCQNQEHVLTLNCIFSAAQQGPHQIRLSL